MRRFFIHPESICENSVTITGTDARHIEKVLRHRRGDRLILFDGSGFDYEGEILGIGPGKVDVRILNRYPDSSESGIRITLAQALLKDRKMDDIVRQMTELGVCRWIPFPAHRSVSQLDPKRLSDRLNRWNRIASESLKQCGRNSPPVLSLTESFDAMLTQSEGADIKIIFWEDEDPAASPVEDPPGISDPDIFMVVGPEGGFTPDEIEGARACGFHTRSLGPRILKADTATVAACTLIQYLYGDMG